MTFQVQHAKCQTSSAVGGADVAAVSSFINSGQTQPPSVASVTTMFADNKIGSIADIDGFPLGAVCSANVINLSSGEPALVASLDYSGRGLCGSVMVVTIQGTLVYASTVPGMQVEDVSQIENVNGFHKLVSLAVPTAISAFSGTNCRAVVPYIYTVSNGAMSDVSKSNAPFYNSLLASSYQYPDGAADAATCHAIEKLALQQFAGRPGNIQPLADQLSLSASPTKRLKAVALFKLRGGVVGKAKLVTMSHDKSQEVALASKQALQELQ